MPPSAGPGFVSDTDILATLKRFDADAEQVLARSGHVSLYNMPVESQQWNRMGVEGPIFLFKRRGTPRFRMMVLNRQSTENYSEDVHGGLDFELNPPYLMYTHGNREIIGVWFYEQDDLYQVEDVLKRIKQTNQTTQPVPPSRTPAPAHREGSGDDNFWDKPSTNTASSHSHQTPQLPSAASVEGVNKLADLLRNAGLKQQQQQQQQQALEQAAPTPTAPSAAVPQPLPPSFFAQQQQPRIQPPPASPPAQAALPSPTTTQMPFVMSQAPQRVFGTTDLAPSTSAISQPNNPLAKLFASAHKAPSAVPLPSAAPAPAAPPPQQPVQRPVALRVSPPQQTQPTDAATSGTVSPRTTAGGSASGSGGPVTDEEKVRRLLTRIATNDVLVKMLAAEMRAVGLL